MITQNLNNMKSIINIKSLVMIAFCFIISAASIFASSHREAPLISNDPLADNVDLYAFRSPDDPNTVTIIATYVPLQLPQGGPNYYTFGQNIRYEVHVDNDASVPGDEITYRFTFNQVNEDPTTFFNIRLGQQNLKTTYTLERSIDGGNTFETIITNGVVPPNNIGPRSIESPVGLGTTYSALYNGAITSASTGERVFAGPTDDPFFVDLGGIFDLGDAARQDGNPSDGLACYNVSAIAIQVPISTLLKAGAPAQPTNILDSDYVIGVWASASRPAITTISADADPTVDGDWIQVSRLGMPLTNEAVIPIGQKDFWNAITPYDEIAETTMDEYFYNPELALYMDDDLFGGAVPAFSGLRVQTNSLGAFDFSNGGDGLFGLKGADALAGTALDDAVFGTLLLPDAGKPRSVDLWPAFHTGVPNVIPYQLATGKEGNPLAAGKPFVNNFLPNGGDMLRLNMAVPVTQRNDPNFSSLGLIQAAAIGLTVAPFNATADLEFIPNMDGFPNGRRLEDDVTRIELQAVAGVVLAAVGLWYDDFDPATSDSPVTEDLVNVLSYTAGVEANDKAFSSSFPYLAMPSSGTGECSGVIVDTDDGGGNEDAMAGRLFVSSNTQQRIGNIEIDDTGMPIGGSSFGNVSGDADGIFFDQASGLLYQLNRMNGSINIYDNIDALDTGGTPSYVNSTSAGSINGREITKSGNRIVVAQDANDANGQQNRLLVFELSADGRSGSLARIYDVDINLWGIQAVGETLYAVVDNSSDLAIFPNFFAPRSGSISPARTITVDGLVRTHGLHYVASSDEMYLTDVGDAGSDTDGAIFVISDFLAASADGTISSDESIVLAGANTLLGNPVDIVYDVANDMIYVAERANGGGRVLGFVAPSMSGNPSPDFDFLFAGASAVHLPNPGDGEVGPTLEVMSQLYVSSNTERSIGVYSILEANNIAEESFIGAALDADGIYYNSSDDRLYQMNRFNNSLNVYTDVNNALSQGMSPRFAAGSSANSRNAREIAWSNNRIVVAQDASGNNGDQNAFFVYAANNGSPILTDRYNTDINLWGIHLDGERLFAIVDNSNMLAEFDNFFANQGSSVSPSRTISVDGLVRTHGLTYDAGQDIMFLTDIGSAASDSDGAYIIVRNYTQASADGTISMNEQTRISGPNSSLGNPVDIAWDASRSMIFIAERASDGGKVLGFIMTMDSGDLAPSYEDSFPGASAVHLATDIMFRMFRRNEATEMKMDVVVDRILNDFTLENNIETIDIPEVEAIGGELSFSLFPNPAADDINLYVKGDMRKYNNSTLEIFNMAGERLMVQKNASTHMRLDISSLASGQYFVRLFNDEYLEVIKFNKI
jgi:hypothetical protein